MMISTYTKRVRAMNFTLAGGLLALGLAMMTGGVIGILSAATVEPPMEAFSAELSSRCESNLRRAGLSPIPEEKGFTVVAHQIKDPYLQLASISLAVQQCVGYKLDTFCMGEGCPKSPPLHFTLAKTRATQ